MSVTSPKGQEMMGYIPPYYATSIVMQAAMQADGLEFDSLSAALSDTLNQFFVDTATWGLSTWEQTLGITTGAGKPNDQRRATIKSKLRGIGTVNVAMIQNVAESYAYGAVNVINNPAAYSFTIQFCDERGVPPNLADLQAAIETIKPAHLAIQFEFLYTLVSDLIGWGTTVGALKTAGITVGELLTWQPA